MNKLRFPRFPASLPSASLLLALSGLAAGCAHVDDVGPDGTTQALSAAPTPGSATEAAVDGDALPGKRGQARRPGRGPSADGDRGGKPRGPGNPGQLFARWDTDGDGQVSLAEVPDRVRERVGAADQDGDGVITRAEHQTFHDARQAEYLAKADRDGDGELSDAERHAFRETRRAERFAQSDKNGDGALTQDEVDERRWQRIARADADGDGSVTRAEHDAAFAAGKLGPRGRQRPGTADGGRRGMRGGMGGPGSGSPPPSGG